MSIISVKQSLAVIALAISFLSTVAHGQEPQGRRVPPPEAFQACQGKTEGETVSFTTRNETLSATCQMFDGKLAAAPDRNRNQAGRPSGQMPAQSPPNNQR